MTVILPRFPSTFVMRLWRNACALMLVSALAGGVVCLAWGRIGNATALAISAVILGLNLWGVQRLLRVASAWNKRALRTATVA